MTIRVERKNRKEDEMKMARDGRSSKKKKERREEEEEERKRRG